MSCLCFHSKTACKHSCLCPWKFSAPLTFLALECSVQSEELGYGLKTLQFIKRGTYIIEYIGRIVYSEVTVLKILQKPPPRYVMYLSTHWVDADSRSGNMSRYINHSCQPNTEVVLWDFNGRNRAFTQATDDI